jgi:hypothetical protein
MNERIIKLISEADSHARSIADKYAPDCGQVSYLWEDAFRKKFAELIVRECVMMADEFELDVNRSGLVDRMKKHFGVES